MTKASREEVEEWAADAMAIKNSPAWERLRKRMYNQILAELLGTVPGTCAATALHAKLQAVGELDAVLDQFETDRKMYRG